MPHIDFSASGWVGARRTEHDNSMSDLRTHHVADDDSLSSSTASASSSDTQDNSVYATHMILTIWNRIYSNMFDDLCGAHMKYTSELCMGEVGHQQ